MKTIQNIQELINSKAQKSLSDDMVEMSKLYHKFPEKIKRKISEIYVNIGTIEKPEKVTLHYILSNTSTNFSIKMRDELLNEYIEVESKNFIKKVDSISDQLNELKEEISNIKN